MKGLVLNESKQLNVLGVFDVNKQVLKIPKSKWKIAFIFESNVIIDSHILLTCYQFKPDDLRMSMMIKHLYFYIFIALLFANCLGDFNLNFEDVVAIESKDYIKCKFEIQFDDEIVKKADVVCDPFKKKSQNQKLIYEFESKTFHKITLIGIVRRDGKASITSKQITKGNF